MDGLFYFKKLALLKKESVIHNSKCITKPSAIAWLTFVVYTVRT